MKNLMGYLLLLLLIFTCAHTEDVKELSPGHTVTVETDGLKAIFVDNTAFGVHREWYNGIAYLSHKADTTNFFVPSYAGLNFEHIYDGQKWWEPKEALFEPRSSFMRIKKFSSNSVELHQPPSDLHKLESWTKFTVSGNHYIDMEFICTPRAETFDRGYIGLFWASYINTTVNKEYYFIGCKQGETQKKWVKFLTLEHNNQSTVKYEYEENEPTFTDNHRPMLYTNFSDYVYSYPFYYGRRNKMVFILMFDQPESIRFSHSPSGGGTIRDGYAPAWDFQFLIYNYKLNSKYGFKARVVYKIFISIDDIIQEYEKWSGQKINRPE